MNSGRRPWSCSWPDKRESVPGTASRHRVSAESDSGAAQQVCVLRASQCEPEQQYRAIANVAPYSHRSGVSRLGEWSIMA